MTDLSRTQLTTILSALAGEGRNPANKDAALKAIDKQALQLGLSRDEVLAAAGGLLDGRLDPAAWRAQLGGQERAEAPAGERIASSLRIALPELPEGLEITADSDRAVLVDRTSKWALAYAETDDGGTHARWRKVIAGIRKNLGAGKPIAPGDPRVPDLATENAALRARVAELEQQLAGQPSRPRRAPGQQRQGTKEELVIGLLRRAEGATLTQIVEATGWQPHTVRGAFAGALKKKRGLAVTSSKEAGGERVYRIAGE